MDHIVIEGCAPYDGRYELDLERELTTREWGWIKRHAGYLPLAMTDDAYGDPEFACVLAAIALRRAGKIQATEVPAVFERLADAPFGSAIRFESGVEEEPAPADPTGSSSLNGATSGAGSRASSGTRGTPRKRTGTRGSGTSVSAPVTSGN